MKRVNRIIYCLVVLTILCSSLLSLAPKVRVYQKIKGYLSSPFDCDDGMDWLLILKKGVQREDVHFLRKFQSDYPEKFSLFYNDILDDALAVNNFLVISFLLPFKDHFISERLTFELVRKALDFFRIDILMMMVDRYPGLSVPGSSLMHIAVKWQSMMLLKKVCLFQKDIDVRNSQGETPLHCAVREGLLCFVDFLVHQGAHIFLKDECGKTPLQIAEEEESLELFYAMFCSQNQKRDQDIQV